MLRLLGMITIGIIAIAMERRMIVYLFEVLIR